jgi:hypothetical protein
MSNVEMSATRLAGGSRDRVDRKRNADGNQAILIAVASDLSFISDAIKFVTLTCRHMHTARHRQQPALEK